MEPIRIIMRILLIQCSVVAVVGCMMVTESTVHAPITEVLETTESITIAEDTSTDESATPSETETDSTIESKTTTETLRSSDNAWRRAPSPPKAKDNDLNPETRTWVTIEEDSFEPMDVYPMMPLRIIPRRPMPLPPIPTRTSSEEEREPINLEAGSSDINNVVLNSSSSLANTTTTSVRDFTLSPLPIFPGSMLFSPSTAARFAEGAARLNRANPSNNFLFGRSMMSPNMFPPMGPMGPMGPMRPPPGLPFGPPPPPPPRPFLNPLRFDSGRLLAQDFLQRPSPPSGQSNFGNSQNGQSQLSGLSSSSDAGRPSASPLIGSSFRQSLMGQDAVLPLPAQQNSLGLFNRLPALQNTSSPFNNNNGLLPNNPFNPMMDPFRRQQMLQQRLQHAALMRGLMAQRLSGMMPGNSPFGFGMQGNNQLQGLGMMGNSQGTGLQSNSQLNQQGNSQGLGLQSNSQLQGLGLNGNPQLQGLGLNGNPQLQGMGLNGISQLQGMRLSGNSQLQGLGMRGNPQMASLGLLGGSQLQGLGVPANPMFQGIGPLGNPNMGFGLPGLGIGAMGFPGGLGFRNGLGFQGTGNQFSNPNSTIAGLGTGSGLEALRRPIMPFANFGNNGLGGLGLSPMFNRNPAFNFNSVSQSTLGTSNTNSSSLPVFVDNSIQSNPLFNNPSSFMTQPNPLLAFSGLRHPLTSLPMGREGLNGMPLPSFQQSPFFPTPLSSLASPLNQFNPQLTAILRANLLNNMRNNGGNFNSLHNFLGNNNRSNSFDVLAGGVFSGSNLDQTIVHMLQAGSSSLIVSTEKPDGTTTDTTPNSIQTTDGEERAVAKNNTTVVPITHNELSPTLQNDTERQGSTLVTNNITTNDLSFSDLGHSVIESSNVEPTGSSATHNQLIRLIACNSSSTVIQLPEGETKDSKQAIASNHSESENNAGVFPDNKNQVSFGNKLPQATIQHSQAVIKANNDQASATVDADELKNILFGSKLLLATQIPESTDSLGT